MIHTTRSGFTLIELSIVLVIIGLIVGGILVGQDLIKAAEVRAQLSQIEKYNSAVNTFRGKFAAIPGDMPTSTANQFGFTPGFQCNGTAAARDGNGLIEGYPGEPLVQALGETAFFWQDLASNTAGNLIEGQYPSNGAAANYCIGPSPTLNTTPGSTYLGDYFPTGKIGHGNFVYVYTYGGFNWFGLGASTGVASVGSMSGIATIPVIQAYNMDKKIDDGMPVTGVVQAVYLNGSGSWPTVPSYANNFSTEGPLTCFNTTNYLYSIGSLASYGTNGNCALSFRFQ